MLFIYVNFVASIRFLDTLSSSEEASPALIETVDVLIYEHEFFTISFVGTAVDNRGREFMVFFVENKTDYELTFQGGSLAIDGESLGHVSGSDSIAQQSRGRVRFRTAEDFPTLDPSTISGTLRAIDFSRELFDRRIEFSFVNIEVR